MNRRVSPKIVGTPRQLRLKTRPPAVYTRGTPTIPPRALELAFDSPVDKNLVALKFANTVDRARRRCE
jgi:hypothetical protein